MNTLPFVTRADIQAAIPLVIEHLRAGGLIGYPTETVYGFGGLMRDDAIAALASLKSRADTKPFLILIRESGDIPELIWTDPARTLADRFWPGALTLALRVRGDFPARIISSEGTVAVRATPSDGLRALLEALGEPITSSSANTAGAPPASSIDEVQQVLAELDNDDVLLLDGGELPPSLPSTLVDCSTTPPRILREGVITTAALSQVVEIA